MTVEVMSVAKMTDEQYLNAAYRGDKDAASLAMELIKLSHVLDDLVDGDKTVTKDQVIDAFWGAMIRLPLNRFFAEHAGFLNPLMSAALINWQIANAYEQIGVEERNLAHTLRYDLGTVIVMIAFLIGGRQWAEGVGPELRKRGQKQSLADYQAECDKRFPLAPPPPPPVEAPKAVVEVRRRPARKEK
jgi:hypothetical protein